MTDADTPPPVIPTSDEAIKETEPNPPKTRFFLFVIAFFTALGALGLAFYDLREASLLKRDLSTYKQALQTQSIAEMQQQKAWTEALNQMQMSVKKLENTNRENTDTWLIAKVHSLLELAQIEAHWAHNTNTVIALLQQADTTLSRLHESGLLPVRQALATEIARLKAEPVLDLAGLSSQLDAARNLVANLPVSIKTLPQTTTKTPEKTESGWRNHFEQSLDVLKKMVVIQKQDATINPVLSNLHLELVKESIRIHLQEAEWAVLNQNAAIYQSSLRQAIAGIQKHFDKEADITRSLLQQLQNLQKVTLKNPEPDIQTSLNLLNNWIKTQSPAQSTEQSS